MTAITDSSSLKAILHGVLVNIDEIGVLIIGESGTGKSECALELVARSGHRLIADDVVEVRRIGDRLFGSAPQDFAGLINAPGLGTFSVRDMFGAAAFEAEHAIDLCIQFEAAKQLDGLAQIGNDLSETELLGLKVPSFVISDCRARNLPLLVETAVKLRKYGENTAERSLLSRHGERLSSRPKFDSLNA